MSVFDSVKNKIKRFLDINTETNTFDITSINTNLDYYTKIKKNKVWYRANSYELYNFWHKIDCNGRQFWHEVPTAADIVKNCSGITKLMVDIPSNIVSVMLNEISVDYPEWNDIEKECLLKQNVNLATKQGLITGTSVFKVNVDTILSKYPILEVVDSEYVDIYKRYGKPYKFEFYTKYKKNDTSYVLHQIYEYGMISFKLTNEDDNEVPLETLEETAALQDITFDKSLILAVEYTPLGVDLDGHGKSCFDGKDDALHMLDETFSQLNEEVRTGRATVYHPLDEINFSDNKRKRPSSFMNHRVNVPASMGENDKNEIKLIQPLIRAADISTVFNQALDQVLQGYISPSTLGIDVKKLDNAEAQREKEKTTLYTLSIIQDNLLNSITKLVHVLVNTHSLLNLRGMHDDINVNINIHQYNSPSFEAKIEALLPLYNSKVLSLEDFIDELYGDNKTKEEKMAIVERAKKQYNDLNSETQQTLKLDKGAAEDNENL